MRIIIKNHFLVLEIKNTSVFFVIWYENYLVTKDGKIYNVKKKTLKKPTVNSAGYDIIDLYADDYKDEIDETKYKRKRNGLRKKFRVHRLVAEYYCSIPDGYNINDLEVNHKDKNRKNNNYINLEWVTSIENLKHAHCKRIAQYDDKGIIIQEYDSQVMASEKTGINVKNISSALRKNMKAGGYIWKYV